MPTQLEPPSATGGPEAHADYLELLALDPNEDGAAFQELVTQLGIGGSDDALRNDIDLGLESEDQVEPIVDAAFNEIDDRIHACGDLYPFESNGNLLMPSDRVRESVYIFLALLSKYGRMAGPLGAFPERTFEEICASAVKAYLGDGAEALAFGFPRSLLPSGFSEAIKELTSLLGEGEGPRGAPTAQNQKDAKLDVVAWKDFDDRRQGKLIIFGQCATGADWAEKISELQATKWCSAWLLRSPLVDPVRVFFVPHRIPFKEWENANLYGGVFFDRCRIAQFSSELDAPALAKCQAWSEHVINNQLLSQ